MNKRVIVCALALVAGLATPTEVEAVKYMTIGDAVKRFVPSGAKIFKATKSLTSNQVDQLKTGYGWVPTAKKYSFYVGKKNAEAVAYVFVVPEQFNACFHKYAVGMTASGEVIETVVTELSCPRAFPINRKSFLKQFKRKAHTDPLTIHADVDAVTGATLSSETTASATRKAVSLHNLFFGGDQPVTVSAATRAARAKAAGMIQRAIETGETDGDPSKGGGGQ